MRNTALLAALALISCRANDPLTEDIDLDGFLGYEDCDDNNAAIFPGADETCDGVDNNCNGDTDEMPVDATAWFEDADGDGYGNAGTSESACSAPSGFVDDSTDCHDFDPDIHPGADESDCTDPVDYNCDGSVGYEDSDGDGFPACEDCDDADPSALPGGIEVCDGADNDCDGEVDVGAIDATVWYDDVDGDGHGDPDTAIEACDPPEGAIDQAGDCDDALDTIFPGAGELCDGADNDCDGHIDEEASDPTTWYADADGDGYGGSGFVIESCTQPSGFVDSATDCDDLDADAFPGNAEVCDGADNDCNGSVDDGAPDVGTWYRDADGDGYGDTNDSVTACEAPAGYVELDGDCNDGAAGVRPLAPEYCNGVDDDCSGTIDDNPINPGTWWPDADADGFGDAATPIRACSQPIGTLSNDWDCDDGDFDVKPGVPEYCDGADNDCNGTVDDDTALDAPTWWVDTDGDGFGDAADNTTSCSQPTGYVDNASDCDDTVSGPGNTGDLDTCPASSCSAILSAVPGASDGAYWLDPDGTGAYQNYCDMGNGGWTLLFAADGGNTTHVSGWNGWFNAGSTATLTSPSDTGKSAAYDQMGFQEIRITASAGGGSAFEADTGSLQSDMLTLVGAEITTCSGRQLTNTPQAYSGSVTSGTWFSGSSLHIKTCDNDGTSTEAFNNSYDMAIFYAGGATSDFSVTNGDIGSEYQVAGDGTVGDTSGNQVGVWVR